MIAAVFGGVLGVPLTGYDLCKLADQQDEKIVRFAKLFFDAFILAGGICCITALCTAGYVFTPLIITGLLLFSIGCIARGALIRATNEL